MTNETKARIDELEALYKLLNPNSENIRRIELVSYLKGRISKLKEEEQ